MAPPSLHPRLDARDSVLPEDALYEILLRLPAKDLCRLRAVNRSWRSLLSEQHFIAAHTACHPLLVVGYEATPRNGRVLCDIMDLSGRVAKRLHATGDEANKQWVMHAHLDLLCVAIGSTMSCQLLNTATGAVHAMPEGLAAEHAAHGLGIMDYWASTVFGLVASTGEYKALRVLEATPSAHPRLLYEVFTLGGNSQACWRAKQAPPYHVELGHWDSVVINGIVYCLLSEAWDDNAERGLVASFDLETEKWSASIQGPCTNHVDVSIRWYHFSIVALSGSLVLGCRTPSSYMVSQSMDLWFLMDFEKDLWVKQHSVEASVLHAHFIVRPLLVLNDGRIILIHIGTRPFLKIYNPRSKTSADVVEMSCHCVAIGLYEGSLLSVANSTS